MYSNKYSSFHSHTLINKEINFNDGSLLYAGLDIIRDRQYRCTTLGIGLQYNF